MGRMINLIVLFAFLLMLTGCSSAENTTPTTQAPAQATGQPAVQGNAEMDRQEGDGQILIAYFSVPETDGVDTVASASRVAVDGGVVGNTQFVANVIEEVTGGDLWRIETVQTYPGTHEPLLEFAYNELMEGARPELSGELENLDAYDVVFLGYPNWNAELPMPLYTFLEKYDLSGKTIIPFNTHGGSQFSHTIQTIAQLQPNAEVVTNGFTVSRNAVGNSKGDIVAWLSKLGYAN